MYSKWTFAAAHGGKEGEEWDRTARKKQRSKSKTRTSGSARLLYFR
jgi:hypothetical protein